METQNSVNDKWNIEVQEWIPLTAEQEEKLPVIYPVNRSLASQGVYAPSLMLGFQDGSYKSCTRMYVNNAAQVQNDLKTTNNTIKNL